MGRPRKTLDVGPFARSLQLRLDNATPLERPVLCSVIEHALFQSGNYNGFRYRDGYNPKLVGGPNHGQPNPDWDEYDRVYYLAA